MVNREEMDGLFEVVQIDRDDPEIRETCPNHNEYNHFTNGDHLFNIASRGVEFCTCITDKIIPHKYYAIFDRLNESFTIFSMCNSGHTKRFQYAVEIIIAKYIRLKFDEWGLANSDVVLEF